MFEFLKRKKNTVKCANIVTDSPTKQEENPLHYTDDQIIHELDIIKQRIINSIGEGSYTLSFEKCETYYKIIGSLFITKNDKIYNSLFQQLFWQIRYDYPKTVFELLIPDLIEACQPLAKRHNITMKLTNWTIERIFIDHYSLANHAREEHGIERSDVY